VTWAIYPQQSYWFEFRWKAFSPIEAARAAHPILGATTHSATLTNTRLCKKISQKSLPLPHSVALPCPNFVLNFSRLETSLVAND
jgi:hypothetical protein